MFARIFIVLLTTSLTSFAQSPQWAIGTSINIPGSGPFSSSAGSVACADLEGDGDIDIMALTPGTPSSSILLNQGNGTFVVVAGPVASATQKLTLGDVTGDQLPDAFAVYPSGGLTMASSTGNGAFAPSPIPFGLTTVTSCALADINNDGLLDLVTTGTGQLQVTGDVKITMGAGSGQWALPLSFPACANPQNVTIGDLDIDGRPDVVANCSYSMTVMWNTPSGYVWQDYGRGGSGHASIADFTGDGRGDIMTAGGRLLVGSGPMAFTVGTQIPQIEEFWSHTLDCDGDGKPDVVLGSGYPTYGVAIARNQGNGAFDSGMRIYFGNTISAITSANVIGDPRQEIIVIGPGTPGGCSVHILKNLAPDCNANGIDDPVEMSLGLSPDCNNNGIPDSCEIDCDDNGQPDACQIALQPTVDLDHDGVIDSCEAVGTPYCFGDGTGASCPCDPGQAGPVGGGCAHSEGGGGRFRATGNAQVSLDSVTLHATGLPQTAVGLFFQGTSQQAGGIGSAFGDGLLCVNGTIIRMWIRGAAGGVINLGREVNGDPSISSLGLVPPAGGTNYYQVWYRDAGSFCTPSTYNLTNALTMTWIP